MTKTENASRPQRRQARAPRASGLVQRPFGRVIRPYKPIEVLSGDQIASVHQAALKLLQTTGIRVLDAGARDRLHQAGAAVVEQNVRLDASFVTERLMTVPKAFQLSARNPKHNLYFGGDDCIFASVGGPAYVMDIERGRHDGSYDDLCDYLKLVQSFNIIHQEGGGPFEPMDLPANTRHLDIFRAQITILDKNWQTQTLGRARTIDGIELAALSLGCTVDALVDKPALLGIINTNSPLQLDVPMAEGLITMAEHGQVNVITPFTLSGAMSPITLAGALVQQHAEALLGIVLTQVVRPGVPVMYGGFTSNVDMRSGAPAFGTPEYAKAAQASGQLARHIGVPFRSSNVTAANAVDAQSAYESMFALWGSMMGGAHLIEHAAGWMHGGLTASFEKLVLDCELLQMMAAYYDPIIVDDASLALDVIGEVGPGGHFFGTAHTMSRYENAFYAPMISNWDNFQTWQERGSPEAPQRANAVWKQVLADYQAPQIDQGIVEEIDRYIARRKDEGGAPLN